MHATPSAGPEITVGIDVSKASLGAYVEPTGTSRSFDNDKCGRRALRNWARQQGATRAALEPTGRFHRALHQCLTDAGIEVLVVNPRRTRNFARSIGREAKNDLTDAAVLALFARLQLAQASEPKAETLRQLGRVVFRRNRVGPTVDWAGHTGDDGRVPPASQPTAVPEAAGRVAGTA